MILENTFSKKCRKIVKLETQKDRGTVVGENLGEIRPIGGESSKMRNSPKWGSSKDDSGKYILKSAAESLNRKSRKTLVIVVGENLTEIRPLGTEARKWQNIKNGGSSEVMIPENTPREMA